MQISSLKRVYLTTNKLSMVVTNSFVEYRVITEKTNTRALLILNISDIIKLVNDKKIENILVKGSSICYY